MGRKIRCSHSFSRGTELIFAETPIEGAYVIDIERVEDHRGFFARTWCANEFAKHGLNPRLVQCNISFNAASGTLRGMHYQAAPHGEAKLVRCTMGSIYDVIVDLRESSPNYLRWYGVELSAANRRMLYIPEGVGHGFQTLVSDSEVFYQMSEFYHPESQTGVRWNDPAFGIHWIDEVRVISPRDMYYPDFAG